MEKSFSFLLRRQNVSKFLFVPYLSCYDTRMFETYTYMHDGFSIYQGAEHSNCLELLFSLQTIGACVGFFIIILKGWNLNGEWKSVLHA